MNLRLVVVITGLDPVIHVDTRVEPAYDGKICCSL